MNHPYTDIQNELRQQTFFNTNLITKRIYDSSLYNTDYNSNPKTTSVPIIIFKMISVLSLLFVLTCYFYGGQDIEKGVIQFSKNLSLELNHLEHQSPFLEETIGYCKKGYHYIRTKSDEILQ